MTSMRKGVAGGMALLIFLAAPALAQNACQTALQQVQQSQNQSAVTYQNGVDQLNVIRTNAVAVCNQANASAAASATLKTCVDAANQNYSDGEVRLKAAMNTAIRTATASARGIGVGPLCSLTAEQIAQFVTQASQAAAQLAQGAAQIISAAKSAKTPQAGEAKQPPPPTPTPKPPPP